MNFGLDKFVGATKQFGSDDDNGGGSVSNLLVLFLGEVDEDSSSGMFNGQQRQNSSAVVGYCDFLRSRWRSVHWSA